MMIDNKEKHLIGRTAAVSTTSFNQKSNSLFHIEENSSLQLQYHSPQFNINSANQQSNQFLQGLPQNKEDYQQKRLLGQTSSGHGVEQNSRGIEFDRMFQKSYFEDEVINPPDSNSGGLNTMLSSPQKLENKITGESTTMITSNINITNAFNDEESILESMSQLLQAVNNLHASNKGDNVNNASNNLTTTTTTSKKEQSKHKFEADRQKSPFQKYLSNKLTSIQHSTQNEYAPIYQSQQLKQEEPAVKQPPMKFALLKMHEKETILSQKDGDMHQSKISSISFQQSNQEVSKDVIERLFQSHKRVQDNKEKQKMLSFQKEMNNIKDRPLLSNRTQQMMANSGRFRLPIHSPERYSMDIQSYRLKKESYQRQKEIEEKEKQMLEDEDIMKNSISKPNQKLDLHAFYQKYNNQLTKWENVKSGLKPSGEPSEHSFEDQNFTPKLNKKSRDMAQNIERIDKRIAGINEDKRKKIEDMQKKMEPTFTPKTQKHNQQLMLTPKSPLMSSTPTQLNDKMGGQNQLSRNSYLQGQQNKTEVVKPQKFVSNFTSQEWAENYAKDVLKNELYLKTSSRSKKKDLSKSKTKQNNSALKSQDMTMNVTNLMNTFLNESSNNSQPIEITNSAQYSILEQYMKLKEEISVSLSNRASQAKVNTNLQEPGNIDMSKQSINGSPEVKQQGKEDLKRAKKAGDKRNGFNTEAYIQNLNTLTTRQEEDSVVSSNRFYGSKKKTNENKVLHSQLNKSEDKNDSMKMKEMFSNLLGSIEQVTHKLSNIDEKKQEFGNHSILEETQRLKSIKMTPIRNHYSFNQYQDGIKDSWQSAIGLLEQQNHLKNEESYNKILQSKSFDSLCKSAINQNLYFSKQLGLMSSHDQEILEKSKGSPARIRQKMIDREQSIQSSKRKNRFKTVERKSDLVNYDIFDQTAEIKQEMSFENQNLFSNYKANIEYNYKSGSSPQTKVDQSQMGRNSQIFQQRLSNISDISKYVDQDTNELLQNAMKHGSNKRDSIPLKNKNEQDWINSNANQSFQQDQMIRKIVQTNSKNNDSLLKIPKEVISQIEDMGLDSLSIMRHVIQEFPHLFDGRLSKSAKKSLKRHSSVDINISKKTFKNSSSTNYLDIQDGYAFTLNKNM